MSAKLDRIHLAWLAGEEKGRRSLLVRVNDEDLVEIIRRAEAASASADGQPDLAGSYAGLDDRTPAPAQHLLGEPDSLFDHDGRTEVLVCSGCREPGCWPLLARIEVGRTTVRWSDFSQPHRPHWDYGKLRKFVFSRTQYDEALRGLEGEPTPEAGAS